MRKMLVEAAVFATFAGLFAAPAPIVFDTPAADEKGIMILGNGELGAVAWLTADGTLHTVLQNSDSWNEGGRHVKTGAIDYVTEMPVDGGTFRQELSMARGEFAATWKSGCKNVSVRYRDILTSCGNFLDAEMLQMPHSRIKGFHCSCR